MNELLQCESMVMPECCWHVGVGTIRHNGKTLQTVERVFVNESETEQQFRLFEDCLLAAISLSRNQQVGTFIYKTPFALVSGTLNGQWDMTPKIYRYAKRSIALLGRAKAQGINVRFA